MADAESVGSSGVLVSFENEHQEKKDAYETSRQDNDISSGPTRRKRSSCVSYHNDDFIENLKNFNAFIAKKMSKLGLPVEEDLNDCFDKDVVLIKVLENFNAFITKKMSKKQVLEEQVKECIASVRAMGLPIGGFVRACDKLTGAATQAHFLSLQDSEKRAWVESLGA